jgi:hypothetical protein
MVNVIAAASLAIGGYFIVKAVRREMARVEKRVSEAARKSGGEIKTLERDPVTGRYHPKD